MSEPILEESTNRFVLFPIKYHAIWDMYKKAESAFWTAEEVDISNDLADWKKLSDNERHFIKHILAFFAGSDGIVNENLGVRFMNDVKIPEAKAFYGFQMAIENVHCVSGDTEILTDLGYCTIRNLAGKEANVWNGEVFSKVTVLKTADRAQMWHVKLSNGMSLKCTSHHKWIIQGQKSRVYTHDLAAGMTIKSYDFPCNDHSKVTDPDFFVEPWRHGHDSLDETSAYDVREHHFRPQHFVPVSYSVKTRIAWLSGLMSSAVVQANGIELYTHRTEFAKTLQLMLTGLGIFSDLELNDHKCHHLRIDMKNVAKMMDMGIELTRVDRDALVVTESLPITVKSVYCMDVFEASFCFEEPLKHQGVFSGIMTGQSEMYSLLIDTYIKDEAEKYHLLNAISTIPVIARKAAWAMKYITDQESSFATRLIAFSAIEGIYFSGAFCSIYYLAEKGVLPGLIQSNALISRDEACHVEFAVLLYHHLKNKLSDEAIHAIIKSAVEIEQDFICVAIPCDLLGMNATLMTQYIQFVADRLLVQLGAAKLYNVTNPFGFMDRISVQSKSNFFETRETNYAKAMDRVCDFTGSADADEDF